MRRRVLGLLASLVPAVSGALIACEGDSSTGGAPIITPDGGAFEGGGNPDAPVAPTDSAVPSTAVSVTIVSSDGPRDGVTVAFQDATGAVIETKTTVAGKASSTGATPAMVSALFERDFEFRIVTWTGVEAGDTLSVNDTKYNGVAGTYDVSLTAVDPAADRYVARVGACASGAPPWNGTGPKNLVISYRCAAPKNAVLVEGTSTDASDYRSFAFAKNVAAPGTPAVPVTVGAFVPAAEVTVVVNNLPSIDPSGFYPNFVEIVGGNQFDMNATATFAAAGTKYRSVPGFAEAGQMYMGVYNDNSLRIIAKRVAAPYAAGSLVLDFANALPRVTGMTLDAADRKRPVISWTTESPMTKADGAVVDLGWAQSDTQYRWTIVVPPGASSVKAPVLPPLADSWFPVVGGDEQYREPQVIFVESDLVPDYAALRRQQGALLDSPFGPDYIPALPKDGTISLSTFAPNRD